MRVWVHKEPIPDAPPPVYFIGVDLGQANDPTAITVLSQLPPKARPHWHHDPTVGYACQHIERLPLGMAYQRQVQHLEHLVKRLDPEQAWIHLALDATGVGRPVTDLLLDAPIAHKLYPISITGGDRVAYEQPVHRVPKRDLISTVALLLQNKRLKFAEGLPVLPTMLHELLNFKVKVSDTGHDSYSAWREQDHDDLVLALACAAWVAEVQTTYVSRPRLPPSVSFKKY